MRDVKYAFRMMVLNKGWTVVAVLSLAVGLGVNTALFSIINSVLWSELPVRNPDELVALGFTGDNDLNICCNNRMGVVGQFSWRTFERYVYRINSRICLPMVRQRRVGS